MSFKNLGNKQTIVLHNCEIDNKKDYIYLNGEKYRPQDISPINIFSFVTLKNEILDFLGWPYYILEKLTILYAMFNFIGFLFSL